MNLASGIAIGASSFAQSGAGTIESRFAPPAGFHREPIVEKSFGAYLRALPLKASLMPVLLHDGSLKNRQDVHAAVVDLSVSRKDLQQCADAVMRLRAEHLYSVGRQDEIAFRFTSGFNAEWKRWRKGERIAVSGNKCQWRAGGTVNSSKEELLRFLEMVFTYAGTRSLESELAIPQGTELSIGDVFIQGGSPGHAVIVVDKAKDNNGRMAFLLAQSYMPAQDIHVLRNPRDAAGGAWFIQDEGEQLVTPEWTFNWSNRRSWP